MTKKTSNKRWLFEHRNDIFVKQAQKAGWRSRAIYKLLEIIQKDNLIRTGHFVLDLGAAPGSWSQLAIKTVGNTGCVVANDISPIKAIDGVDFIQGDFREKSVQVKILATLQARKFDVVLSDMAPNISGHPSVDIPKVMALSKLALDMAGKMLNREGCCLVKIFQGEGFEDLVAHCRQKFNCLYFRKPKASKSHSREMYLLASGLKRI